MKKTSLIILILAMAIQAFSQDHQIIHIWPGKVPGETAAKHPAKVTDDHHNNITRLTDVTDPTLTVFQPEASKRNGAAVVVCPGGGYQILAIDLEGYDIAKWLNEQGFTAFVLEYRVPKKQAGALQDVQRAMRIVKSRANEYHLDTAKIGVMGFSAGGSLSARVSTLYDEQTYEPIDQADSLSCKPAFAVLIYPAYLDLGSDHSITPELKVNSSMPPMFLFSTNDDPYGNSSLVMAEAMRQAKADVEMHYYPKGGHGYGLRKGNPAAEAWPPLAKAWLKTTVLKSE